MRAKTGGVTVTRHKAHVPKIQNNDNQPFTEDDTFVPKNVGVKSNLIFLHIYYCAFGRCNTLSTTTYFTLSQYVEFASIP
jgi:hypothetical protein